MPTESAPIEITPPTARELLALDLATLLDVRQPFERELEGAPAGGISVPLFHFKHLLGHKLDEEEQELLDADEPDDREIRHFLSEISDHHFGADRILLCLCNSGRRSLHAARLLRELGFSRSLSVTGGWRCWQ
jgi:rhodanese-related sulfurtransferase